MVSWVATFSCQISAPALPLLSSLLCSILPQGLRCSLPVWSVLGLPDSDPQPWVEGEGHMWRRIGVPRCVFTVAEVGLTLLCLCSSLCEIGGVVS